MTLPDNVQYACLHANGRHAYVACSDGAPGSGPRGRRHWLVAFQVAPGTGALHAARPPLALAERPIHIATDRPCAHLLVAFNNPAAVRVWRIAEDGTLGGEVEQPATLQPGIFPHQVCAAPDGRHVTVTARGNDATPERAEEPGRLSVFRLQDGVLQPHHVVAPQGGFGFGPRDAAFHPRRPWLYVSLERQNELAMLDWADAAPRVVHRRTTLADPGQRAGRQIAGAVQLHPRGQVVYVANRASETMTVASREVLVGGENSLAVFALDPDSGEPRLIQSVDTQASIRAPSRSTPAGGCWWWRTSWAGRGAGARGSRRCRGASPPSPSPRMAR